MGDPPNNPQSAIANPQPTIRNRQSAIPIGNPQSAIRNVFFKFVVIPGIPESPVNRAAVIEAHALAGGVLLHHVGVALGAVTELVEA
jgi:hypothetical protein